MHSKKIISGVCIVLSIGLYLLSHRLNTELAANTDRLNQAQTKIDSQTPELIERPRNRIKDHRTTDAIQKNIDQSKQTIAEYTQFVAWIQIASAVSLLLGVAIGIKAFKTKSQR